MNILISAYFGFGNCGDEAILLAMVRNISALSADIRLTALSYHPEETKAQYGIGAVNRFNLLQVWKAIRHTDILLMGGGTLLQDDTSTRSLFYYLGILLLGILAKKKIMLYANGIGPVNRRLNRRLIRRVVNHVDLITLRESFALEELRLLGVTKPEIHVTADPVFTLAEQAIPANEARELLNRQGVPAGKPILAVSVREWPLQGDWRREVAAVCDHFAGLGYVILFIPMQYKRDLAVSKLVMDVMTRPSHLLEPANIQEILGVIGLAELVCSMRLHTLIFAGVEAVPMLGIAYEPKVSYYLDLLRMPAAAEPLDGQAMIAQMEELAARRGQYASGLGAVRQELLEQARENERRLKGLIDVCLCVNKRI